MYIGFLLEAIITFLRGFTHGIEASPKITNAESRFFFQLYFLLNIFITENKTRTTRRNCVYANIKKNWYSKGRLGAKTARKIFF